MTTETKTFYPRVVSQTTGGKYAKFNDLNVIKATNNGYAQTVKIDGKKKTPNRPSTITCSDFNMKIPVGAVVTKVQVEYKHLKVASGGSYNNIPAPTVSLMSGNNVISVKGTSSKVSTTIKLAHKSGAPKATPYTQTPTFNGKEKDYVYKGKKYTFNYELPSREVFNATSFGVKIDYPTNTNDNAGYLRLYWVRIKVTYTTSTYTMSATRVYGGTNHDGTLNNSGGYNHMEYRLKAKINRKSKTAYIPKVTITTPVGFTFKGAKNVVQKSATALEWTPELPNTRTTASDNVELSFDVDVTYASGQTSYNATFEFVESLNNTTVTHSTTIIDRPDAPASETGTGTDGYSSDTSDESSLNRIEPCVVNEEFTYSFKIDDDTLEAMLRDLYEQGVEMGAWSDPYETIRSNIINSSYGRIWISKDTSHHDYTDEWNLSKNDKMAIKGTWYSPSSNEWNTAARFYTISDFMAMNNELTVTLKGTENGYDEISAWLYYYNYYSGELISNTVYSWKFIIKPQESSLTTPNISLLVPTDEEQNRLGDNHKYTVQSNIKLTTSLDYVPDWYKNFRIGVFNNPIEANITRTTYIDDDGNEQEAIIDTTDYDNLSIDDIFSNAEYWSNAPPTPNEYANLECQFMHDKDYPLYILLVGDYPEGDQSNNTIRFTEPCIVESDLYKGRLTNGIFPIPIDNLVSNDNDTAEITLEPLGASNNFILCEFPLDDGTGTDDTTAIQGIEVTGNIEASDELVLYAKLKAPDGNTGQRSIILSNVDTTTDGDHSFTIGGQNDLWGFSILDMTNLEDWEIELGISNALQETQSTLNFGDIQVNIYTETIDEQNVHCYINGENMAFYGIFLTDLNIPPGLNTDVSFLTIDGTDTNDAYRQNIREKTITLEFEIGDNCDIESNTNSLRQLTRLLTNEKDQYNRPIPKRLTFSHLPDVYYEYIIEDSPEITVEVGTYNVKAKLVIPSGTAYSKNSTTTNTVGYVQGLAKVKPVITVRPTDELIEIRETRSGQKFNMGYNGQWTDKIIEIDCEDRIVWLKTDEDDTDPENITKYCDYNSDWFSLHGEYVFEGTNCVIRTIDYIERW